MKQVVTLLSVLALTAFCQAARANVITVNFPEINSPASSSGFPLPLVNWNTQVYSLIGQTIVSATISGTWGSTSQFVGSTAEAQLFVNGVLVSDTTTLSPDPFNNVVPFSYTYSAGQLASLATGSAILSYIQTSQTFVRLSGTTLTINTTSVPDGGGISCLLLGLAGLSVYYSFGRKAWNQVS